MSREFLSKRKGLPFGASLKFILSAELRELETFVVLQCPTDAPLIGEEQQESAFDILDLLCVGGEVELLQVNIRSVDPTDEAVRKGLHSQLNIVLILHSVLKDVELKSTDNAHNDLLHTGSNFLEDLDSTFLSDLGNALDELLSLHGVLLLNTAEEFRSEGWNTLKLYLFAAAYCVADGEDARVKDTDDIAGVGFLDYLAALSHHLLWLRELDLSVLLNVVDLHALLELAAANSHKGDSVAVSLVHVGLDLKYKGGEVVAEGVNNAVLSVSGKWG